MNDMPDRQNKRLEWLMQTIDMRSKKGDDTSRLQMVARWAADMLDLGLTELAKKQLDRVHVPHVPFLDLPSVSYTVK